jgi:hypothetical protein
MVDEMALEQDFSELFFSPANHHSTIAPYSFITT